MPTSFRNRIPRSIVRAGVLIGIAVLLAAPIATAAAPRLGAGVPAAGAITGASATWNDQPLSTAASASSGFGVTTGESIQVVFSYTFDPLSAPKAPTARIVVLYFGAAISTDQVGATNNHTGPGTGTAVMNWTLGTFSYLLAGVYELTASLVGGGGSTLWSQSFYINVHAPFHVAAGLIVFLLLLGLVEIWAIATVGRLPRKPSVKSSAGPAEWQPPADDAGAPSGGGTPPATPPAAGGGSGP